MSPASYPARGELVTETLAYDGGRRVTVYVPARPAEAVVLCGDGQVLSAWGADLEPSDALTERGAEVVMAERAGGHGDAFWRL